MVLEKSTIFTKKIKKIINSTSCPRQVIKKYKENEKKKCVKECNESLL